MSLAWFPSGCDIPVGSLGGGTGPDLTQLCSTHVPVCVVVGTNVETNYRGGNNEMD